MKKSAKVILAAGAAMCVFGGVLFGIGAISGGSDYVKATDLNRMDGSQDTERMKVLQKTELEDLNGIEIDLESSDLRIELSQDDHYYLSYQISTEKEVTYEVADGVLHFSEQSKDKFHFIQIDISFLSALFGDGDMEQYEEYVVLSVPEEKAMESCHITLDDGDMEAEGLNSKDINTVLESGDLKINNASLEGGRIVLKDGNMQADHTNASKTDLELSYGDLTMGTSQWTEGRICLEDGDFNMDEVTVSQTEIELRFGNITINDSEWESSAAILEDGDMETKGVQFLGENSVKSDSGDVTLGITRECIETLSLRCDTDSGTIDLGTELSGQIIESGEDDTSHYQRIFENADQTLTVQCMDGDITIQ